MSDTPYPGARTCPACWDATAEGRFTATFNGVTHHSRACGRLCMRLGIGARNIDAATGGLKKAAPQYEAVMAAEEGPNAAALERIGP